MKSIFNSSEEGKIRQTNWIKKNLKTLGNNFMDEESDFILVVPIDYVREHIDKNQNKSSIADYSINDNGEKLHSIFLKQECMAEDFTQMGIQIKKYVGANKGLGIILIIFMFDEHLRFYKIDLIKSMAINKS